MASFTVPGYRIEDEVGQGRSGRIFRARRIDRDEIQALKVSHPSPRHSPEDLAFKHEYHLHARLRHENIVRALQFGEVDELHRFYTMEYVPTVPLRELYTSKGIKALAEVALQICRALEYTHAQGTLHADIKPENVLLAVDARGNPSRVLLADFGHAQRIGLETGSRIQGTLAYLAPEAFTGWRLDARSDLYSLGVTLFEAIADRLPYPVRSTKELFHALHEHPMPSVRDFEPTLDERWTRFVDQLVSRNREDRPISATAAAERLAELLGATFERSTAPPEFRFGPTFKHVGRRTEVAQLARLARGPDRSRTVEILGEEGCGKSRLAEEFARQMELEGWPVVRSDAREASTAGFRLLRRVWQDGASTDLTETAFGRATPPADVDPRGQREAELERLVDAFLVADDLSRRERLYLFDSVDCADLDSIEFLKALSRRVAGTSSLLCLVGRTTGTTLLPEPEATPTIRIALEPFCEEDVREFLVAHLGLSTGTLGSVRPFLDDEELSLLVRWMSEHTGGNPRRMESALRALHRQGYLQPHGNHWRLDQSALEGNPLPITPEERALERLGQLAPDARRYLEFAAVAGSEFDTALLAALDGFDDEVFAEFLSESLRLGILVQSPGAPPHLRFLDPELRRALVDAMPSKQRAELHLRLAEHLERNERTENLAEVARHFEGSNRRGRARDAYLKAAYANRRAGAFREAGVSFRKAWELHTPSDRTTIPAFAPDWIRTLHTNSHNHEGAAVADEILSYASGEQTTDVVETTRILHAVCLEADSQREPALEILKALLAHPKGLSEPAIEAWALTTYGKFQLRANELQIARRAFLRAREISIAHKNSRARGEAEMHLGILAYREDDSRQGLAWQERAHGHLLDAGADDLLPGVWGNQAICSWDLLEARQAARFHRRAAEGYVRQHRRAQAARSYQNLAYILTEIGHWSEADEALQAADHLARSVRSQREASFFEYSHARLAYYRGQLRVANEHIDKALALARDVGDPQVIVGHRSLRGLIEIATGASSAAEATGREGLVQSRQLGHRWGIVKNLYLLGEASRQQGRLTDAVQYLDDALGNAQDWNLPVLEFSIQISRAELNAELDLRDEALDSLSRARVIQERCESVLWEGRLALAEGRLFQRSGDHGRACTVLANAYEVFANLEALKLQADSLAALAHTRTALGNRNAGLSAWRHTQSLYQNLGLPLPDSPFSEDTESDSPPLLTVQRILEAASTVSREITMIHSVDRVLERILDVAITHLGTERGVIALLEPDTGELRVRLARNIDREAIGDGLRISRSTLDSVGQEGELVHSGDALADPRLSIHESIREGRIRSLISLPIRLGDQILGALYMDHRQLTDLFGEEECLFLRFIADMAAIGIRNAQRFERAEDRARNLRGELAQEDFVFPGTIVGRTPKMRDLVSKGIRAARARRVLLLTGENGVGKDHIARVLHDASGQGGIFVNCPLPTVPESLIQSELFGSMRGAATSVETRPGLAEAAQGGTLFLNEIAELPMTLQAVLLDFIETRKFRRVGGTHSARLDGLIICATNAPLEERVAEGTFREDLYYRLNQCVLPVPPLRERAEDIPDLVDLFLREAEERTGRDGTVVHPLALDLLLRCSWEGNIRELKNCLSSAVDHTSSRVIERSHLDSPSLRKFRENETPAGRGTDVREEVELVEIHRIHEAMTRCGGVIRRAARQLGLPEAALRRRIRKHGLQHLVLKNRRRSAGLVDMTE